MQLQTEPGFTLPEAAKILGIHDKSIYRLVNQQKIQAFLGLEHLATVLGCARSWEDERLLRRSAQEDRRSRGERDAQVRSRSHLRRGHLLRQALRGNVPRGEVASPEEASRLQAQAG